MLAARESEKRDMRVRLRQVGDQLMIPIPPSAASSPAFAAGEVDVEWEPGQGILVVRTASVQAPADPNGGDFGEALEHVLSTYGNAYLELIQGGR